MPFKDELIEELRFIAKFHGSTKPVRKRHEDNDSAVEQPFEPLSSVPAFGGWFENNEKKTDNGNGQIRGSSRLTEGRLGWVNPKTGE